MDTVPIPTIERPVFFDGQRLTSDDLGEAFAYERELRWLHNRSLHGWGIVLGYAVTGARGAASVTVSPGYALDCAGRDVVLERPEERAVPPVAAATTWYLVASYADDARVTERRAGACATDGAVRVLDEPTVRWLDASGQGEERLRPGLDLVLALAAVRGCRLESLSLKERRQVPQANPYAFAGQTPVGATSWRTWTEAGKAVGVTTTVSTAAAGFLATPVYQARLAGRRGVGSVVSDGFGSIAEAGAASFEFRVALPFDPQLRVTGPEGPGRKLNDGIDLAGLRDRLRWHVVWMGLEAP